MIRYCFDVEIFKNFFCCSFVNIATKEVKTFVIWKYRDDKNELLSFIDDELFLVSFNGLSYDLPVLRYIRSYRGESLNRDLYKLSAKLISESHRQDDDIKILRYPRYEEPFIHIDLMSMMNFVRTGVGLKQCSINLKWHKVQDLPLEHNHLVVEEDVDEIVSYNINDVLITLELYNDKRVKEAREVRETLIDDYGTEILSASKSRMANIFFEKKYEDATGISRREFKELRTPRSTIKVSDIIFPNIKFKTEKLNNLLTELKELTLLGYEDFKFSKSLFYKGNEYVLGVGGLHTNEKPALYRETDTHEILSMDVSSFYPAIMCEYNVKPEHLKQEFIDILSNVKKERIKTKKLGDKTKDETYKILVNATFGKLGFPSYWFYDPFALISVTLNGQLFLLMLIEKMEENNIHCLSGNTDGCELLVAKELKDKAYTLAKEWEQETRFDLEYTNYSLLAKRDVNNYLAVDVKGKKKTKGAFIDTVELEKGYLYPIVPRAVNEYFIKGVPVEQTIYKNKDIMDFCISKKSGSEFSMELQTIKGVESLQKTNRFYISNSGGALRKRNKTTNKTIGLFVGKNVRILNDYDSNTPFSDYDVNKLWYIKEARSMIEEIEPSVVQEAMFGTDVDYGKRVNFLGEEIRKKVRASIPKDITEKEIREAKQRKLVYDVSSRVALVTNVDLKWSPKVTLYSLSKGTETKFKVPKAVYSKCPLNYGDVISADAFEQRNRYVKQEGIERPVKVENEYEWWMTSFSPITDFAIFKRKAYDS